MAREHLLCTASAIKGGETRTFTVKKLSGQSFKIYNDRGHSHISHGSLRVTERDIVREIITVYDAQDVKLKGSVLEGVRASTWPSAYKVCSSCGCELFRRAYGGQGNCHRCYYLIRRLSTARGWRFSEQSSLGPFVPRPFEDYLMQWGRTAAEFSAFQQAYVGWLSLRIEELKADNDHRHGNLEATDLRRKFNKVLKIMDRPALSPIDVGVLGRSFDKKQMAVIYSLLDDVIDVSIKNSDREAFSAGFEAVNKLHIVQRKERQP